MNSAVAIPVATTALHEQMEYARVVSGGALLPQAYRGKPADILIAVGLGQAMGLTPAESLYRIHIIGGKPVASAELIAANVRKAGHRLRVAGDETYAVASIWRADDPDYEFTARWDLARARAMELSGKDNWKKQPGVMMRWRAITEVARLACPEALYGVAYVEDEVDGARETPTAPKPAGMEGLRAAVAAADPAPVDVTDAEIIEDAPAPEAPTVAQNRAMHAAFTAAGMADRTIRLDYCRRIIGREIGSSRDMSAAEVSAVIDALHQDAADTEPTDLLGGAQ